MMKMEFTFDPAAVKRRGYTMESVYRTVKEEFDECNLPCIADGEVLAFGSTGHKNDYSSMLGMMRVFSKSEWFMDVAASWWFTTNEVLGWEDVLAAAKEHNQKRVIA